MKAWEHEYRFRNSLDPRKFRKEQSEWGLLEGILSNRESQLFFLWKSSVPGSFAPDSLFYTAVQAWSNQGYDVSEAMKLLPVAVAAVEKREWGELERLTGLLLQALFSADRDPEHIVSRFRLPAAWEDISASFPEDTWDMVCTPQELLKRIHAGWLGQICGGAYGTAIEGYTGYNLRKAFGEALGGYVTEPETWNDDITFEIALLSAADRLNNGSELTSQLIAEEWLRLIYFGWSAEYCALENLRRGIFPPDSGSFRNPYSEWIGAQMRTMVCGLLFPGAPWGAARLAWNDSRVSHTGNGIYGGIHSAVLTSLAFCIDNPRELLHASREYIPEATMYSYFFDLAMETAEQSPDHLSAWEKLEPHIRIFHWIHAIPNMVAVVLALYYSENEMGRAFRVLGECGLDVDCNAGEVGTILGVMQGSVPKSWGSPIGDELRTYVPGYEQMSIRNLAEWTQGLGDAIRSEPERRR